MRRTVAVLISQKARGLAALEERACATLPRTWMALDPRHSSAEPTARNGLVQEAPLLIAFPPRIHDSLP